jgi:WD40 repeat protein
MLPIHLKSGENRLSAYRDLFAKALCDGYLFDVRSDVKKNGTRYVHYYKSEHSLLVSHTISNRVHVIDLLTGKLRWFDHHGTSVRSILVCNHDIITASWDGSLCVTDFDTLELRLILTEKSMGRCPHVEISPDFKFAYSYSYDSDKNPESSNGIRAWSLENGMLETFIQLPGGHLGKRRCGSCVILNNKIYSVSNSGYFQVFDCYSGKMLSEHFLYDELESLCPIPSHDIIILGGTSGSIYKYNITDEKITQSIKGHMHDVTQLMTYGERPDVLLSVSFDGTLKIWEIPDIKLIASVNVFRNSLWTLSKVNNLILTGGDAGEIWIYDIKDLKNILLKGRMVVFDQSIAYIPVDSGSFYSDNLSTIRVLKKENYDAPESQFAEYLLNSCNTLKVFQDLFNTAEINPDSFMDNNKFMLQIPKTL